jgi:transcriptional regulator with XRE-family HTH domain
MTTIGRRIQHERQSRGWTQGQLAAQVPIGQQSISRWEGDFTRPTDEQIGRLIDVFGLDPDHPFIPGPPASSTVPVDAGPQGRPLLRELPLADLAWEDFERFCRMLVRLLHPPPAAVHRFGSQGHRQGGIDLYAEVPDGTITTYQCKKYRRSTGFGAAKVRAAMTANIHHAAAHFILLSCPATPPARAMVMGTPGWDIWDSEDIANVIREQLDQDARIQLIDGFFPGHRQDFLGVEELGPWLTADRFFLPTADPRALLNHSGSLVGCQETVGRLTAFCSGAARDRMAILSGTGGSGKTRVLRAVADTSPTRFRFLAPHASVRPGQVDQLPPDDAALIIDDAHDTPGLDALFAAIATQRPRLRVIAATRPHAVARIRALAIRAGLADQPLEIPIPDLTLPEATALAAQVLARARPAAEAAQLAREVAVLTRDCPLATVLTAELLNRKQIPVRAVSVDPSFRQHVEAAFYDILTGGLGDPRDADLVERLLEFFALLQPLVPEHPGFDELLRIVIGRSQDELRRPLGALQAAGVLVLRDGMMWLVPDALADVIAERACLDPVTRRPTGYADRLFDQELQGVGLPLRNLLVNVGKLDWHLVGAPSRPATGMLDRIWREIHEQFEQAAHPAQRAALLQAIAEVAYYQPRRALWLASRAAKGLLVADDEECGSFGADLLIAELVKVLRNAAYTYEEAPEACELLWSLARIVPKARNRGSSAPVQALREIAAYSPGKPAVYHRAILETALAWLEDLRDETGASPFDVLDVFLATEATEAEYGDRQFTFRSFTVDPGIVGPLRARVVDAAIAEVATGQAPKAIRALKTLRSALCQPARLDGQAGIRRQWESDLLGVLGQLRNLVATAPLDPLLYTEIRQIVRWHLVHGQQSARDAVRAVLAAMPDTLEVRLTRCLAEGIDPAQRREDQQAEATYGSGDINDRTAREFSQANLGAAAAVAALRERMWAIASIDTRRWSDPGPFTAVLVRQRPDIGEAITDDVTDDPSSPLTDVLSVVVANMAASHPDKAVARVRQLLAVGDLGIDRQIAHAYGPGLSTAQAHTADEITLIEDLSRHPAPGVRRLVAFAAPRIMQTDPLRAMQFLLGIDFAGDSGVAVTVLSQLYSDVVSLGVVPELGRIALLRQLASCPDIDAHPIEMLLKQAARDNPDELVAMLIARIDRSHHRGWELGQVLPYAWEEFNRAPVLLRGHPRFAEILFIVLDWLAAASDRAAVLGPTLFAVLAGPHDDNLIMIIQSWLHEHLDQHGVETAATSLRTAPPSVLLDQQPFVTRLLETAASFGPDCLAAVRTNLLHVAFFTAGASGARVHQLAAQATLRDEARKIVTRLPARSPARAFYRDLADHADQMLRWASAL